jgi:acetyl-CoA carboxylase carboxyl transferase subunit alpha
MNDAYVLPFEWPVVEFESRIAQMRAFAEGQGMDVPEAFEPLDREAAAWRARIFGSLSAGERVQLARHPWRPTARDVIQALSDDFYELRGDRQAMDDPAIVGGIGSFGGLPIVWLGHHKGSDAQDRRHCNSGMPHPEGYRKAIRLMRHAARFNMPLVSLIDTPGAYPGEDAERHNQGGAIANAIAEMASLTVPIVSIVIGEGGSGGALALGVADRMLMLEHAYYSVISPEGCAAILWKSTAKAPLAAQALRLTAEDCHALGVVDEVIQEPPWGAHRDPAASAALIAEALGRHLYSVLALSPSELLQRRYTKYRTMGSFSEVQE